MSYRFYEFLLALLNFLALFVYWWLAPCCVLELFTPNYWNFQNNWNFRMEYLPKIYINYRRGARGEGRGRFALGASLAWTSSNVLINIQNYLHNKHRLTHSPPSFVFVKNVIIAIAARIISILISISVWNKTVKNRMEPVSNYPKHFFLAFSIIFLRCVFSLSNLLFFWDFWNLWCNL